MFTLNVYQRAVIIVILGGIFLSTLGLGIRLMESANSAQVTFYRSVGQSFFMTMILLAQYKGKSLQAFKETGKIGFLAGFFFAGASVFLIFSLNNTTVANAMFVMSLVPFAAAILAWVFLRERVERKTIVAIVVAVFGVSIMINGAISGDGLLGIIYAFIMVFFYASFTVALRAIKSGDSLIAACWGSYMVVLLFGFGVQDLSIPTHDLVLCLALGVFQVGLGGWCLVVGSRHVPAAQISLLAMLEVVLSPIWVWLGVGEVPATMTLIGGAFIMAAIAYQALSRTTPQGAQLA